jgi:hypothetical protein
LPIFRKISSKIWPFYEKAYVKLALLDRSQ